jgi:hypothetical protein
LVPVDLQVVVRISKPTFTLDCKHEVDVADVVNMIAILVVVDVVLVLALLVVVDVLAILPQVDALAMKS